MTDDSLRLRVWIDAPTDTVFKALTDADSLTDWLAESADVSLADDRYQFWGRYAPQGDRPRQRLLTAEPAASLRFSWALDDDAGTGPPRKGHSPLPWISRWPPTTVARW